MTGSTLNSEPKFTKLRRNYCEKLATRLAVRNWAFHGRVEVIDLTFLDECKLRHPGKSRDSGPRVVYGRGEGVAIRTSRAAAWMCRDGCGALRPSAKTQSG